MNNNLSSSDELKAIRKLMEESTRFLSLSGFSGIFAGIFAIAGALVAWFFILGRENILYDEYFRNLSASESSLLRLQLVIVAGAVLVLSVISAFWFSAAKARKSGKKMWTPASERLLVNLAVPLVAGGIFILILLLRNNMQMIVPGMLIFYGLALVSAGKFTYTEVFYLGILQITTGLIAALFTGYGLLFWIIGFGMLHIMYGLFMLRKYDA
jgi:hypothetical protein